MARANWMRAELSLWFTGHLRSRATLKASHGWRPPVTRGRPNATSTASIRKPQTVWQSGFQPVSRKLQPSGEPSSPKVPAVPLAIGWEPPPKAIFPSRHGTTPFSATSFWPAAAVPARFSLTSRCGKLDSEIAHATCRIFPSPHRRFTTLTRLFLKVPYITLEAPLRRHRLLREFWHCSTSLWLLLLLRLRRRPAWATSIPSSTLWHRRIQRLSTTWCSETP